MTDKVSSEFKSRFNEEINPQLKEFVNWAVFECSRVLQAHAEGLERFHIDEKADEAFTCSRIILEHFNLNN